MSWITPVAWAAVPVAFALEVLAALRVLRSRSRLVEAWLCAGARPLEALARVRGRFRPAIVVAALVIVPVLVWPPAVVPAGFVLAVACIGAAAFAGSILVAMRTFVDSRLVDRPPAEARTPFRLKPYEPPAALEVYDSRPPAEAD